MLGWEPISASIERETAAGRYLLEVLFDGMALDSRWHLSTWEANDIAEGATVSLQLRKASLEEVVRDMVDLNPHCTVEELMDGVTFEEDIARRPAYYRSQPRTFDGTLKSWNLRRKGLTMLPESFGDLKVGGFLSLYENQLTTLPESFGFLTVGGYLGLGENQLTTLPESFGSLTVGRDLDLEGNQLTTLPEIFPNVRGQVGANNHRPVAPRETSRDRRECIIC